MHVRDWLNPCNELLTVGEQKRTGWRGSFGNIVTFWKRLALHFCAKWTPGDETKLLKDQLYFPFSHPLHLTPFSLSLSVSLHVKKSTHINLIG